MSKFVDPHVEHVRVHIIRMFKDKDPSGTRQFRTIQLLDYITTKEKSEWWAGVVPLELPKSINKYVREYLCGREYGEVERVSRGIYRLNPKGALFHRLRSEVGSSKT